MARRAATTSGGKRKTGRRPPAASPIASGGGTAAGGWGGGERVRGTYSALGYRSARTASHEGRSSTAASGTRHELYDRANLLAQSREFYRDNGIYRGIIDRTVGYLVGNGFGLQARTEDAEYNTAAETLWTDWVRRPEIRNRLTGGRFARMIAKELLLCGDTGAILTNRGQVQLVEAETIAGPGRTDSGIAEDTTGTPLAFYVAPYGKGGQVDVAKARKYTPDVFLYLCDPERPSSSRGLPPCQSAFPMLHRINDVCDSEAIAWQLLARLAVATEMEGAAEDGYAGSKADGSRSRADGDFTDRVTEMDYAIIFHGRPGESIKGIDRNIPGANFPNSIVMFLRLLGLPLGVPLEIILLDWTKSNYSQSRAVLEQTFQTFTGWQEILEGFAYRPIYEWLVGRWLDGGELDPPAGDEDPLKHEWIKPTWPWIDQLKEAQAWGAKLDRSLTTHGIVCKSLGMDRSELLAARKAEVIGAIEMAQEIEDETGVKVPWQPFAGLEESKPAPTAAAAPAGAGGDAGGGDLTAEDAEDAEQNGEGEEEETDSQDGSDGDEEATQ